MTPLRDFDAEGRLIAAGVRWKDRVPWIGSLFWSATMGGFVLMGFALLSTNKSLAMFGFVLSVASLIITIFHWKTFAIVFNSNGKATTPHGTVDNLLMSEFPELFFRITFSMRQDEDFDPKQKTAPLYEVIAVDHQGRIFKIARNVPHDGAFLLVSQLNLAKEAMLEAVSRDD